MYDIMSAKGRVKCPDTHMPSLFEHMCVRTFDERRDKGYFVFRKTEGFSGFCL